VKEDIARDLGSLGAVLTVKQAADVLQLGTNRTYDLIRSGELKAVKVGSVYRIPRASLQQFLGVSESDLLSQQQARREQVDLLLVRYRAASDELSRVAGQLVELGVVVSAEVRA